MEFRELSDDISESIEAEMSISSAVRLLQTFKPGEAYKKQFRPDDISDTSILLDYVLDLRGEGLDIGRETSKFGYKMPKPNQTDKVRFLEIYRQDELNELI